MSDFGYIPGSPEGGAGYVQRVIPTKNTQDYVPHPSASQQGAVDDSLKILTDYRDQQLGLDSSDDADAALARHIAKIAEAGLEGLH